MLKMPEKRRNAEFQASCTFKQRESYTLFFESNFVNGEVWQNNNCRISEEIRFQINSFEVMVLFIEIIINETVSLSPYYILSNSSV